MHKLAASIMCANQIELKQELTDLEKSGIELLHCDVMDGVFVNNLAMGPYVLEQIKASTNIPLDIHLATVEPSKYIDMYAYIKPDYISFHVETSDNVERDIYKLNELGIKPVLALSPESPIEMITPYLSLVPMLLIMTVNPGFAGQKFNYAVLNKLEALNKILETMEQKPLIEVDGNINKHTISALRDLGANVYVLGTSALFNKQQGTYKDKLDELRDLFQQDRSILQN